MSERTKLLEKLVACAEQLEDDAVEVLVMIGERLVMGQKQYGRLDLNTDQRDFHKEALAEDLDGLVYRSAATIQALRKSRE